MLLRLQGIAKSFGSRSLFRDVSFQVGAGDRIGLVGPNGAGKTTLLRIAAGDDPADAGTRAVARGARIGMLRQEIDPTRGHSVREEVASALAELDALEAELRGLERDMEKAHRDDGDLPDALAERYDVAQARFQHLGGFEREARIERILAGLGFDEERRDRPLRTFSGGWLMRVELAKLLLAEPDVLLLDEPTNHLDLPSIAWFEETLMAFRGGVVVISHDRTFLRRHVKRVAELAGGRFCLYEGGWERYLAERERRQEELLARKQAQDREIARTERFVARFRAKSTKARQVQSRVKALAKIERIEVPQLRHRRIRLRIPPSPRAGAVPIALTGIHKAYEDTVVYRGIDLEIRRGERVAMAGPNGAGKSTLLRILAGVLPFDRGERKLGHRVETAFYAQHQLEALEAGRSVLEELETAAHREDVPRLRGHLGAFLFSGSDVDKKVSVLSGGEKARLALAKMLLRPANALILDEPTNHLDVEACEVLEEALRQYDGTLIFISHDRAFINALATRVIEVKDGKLRDFLGNYDDYQRKLLKEAEGPGPRPGEAGDDPPRKPRPRAAPAAPTPPRSKAERAASRERRKAQERLRRKIERLEEEILARESAVEALGWKLGDPQIYQDPEQTRALDADRSALREEIASRYRDWERLAAELEALGE